MILSEPWSKKHKAVTKGTPFSLSNSFAEPLSNAELIARSLARGDQGLVDDYQNHALVYTESGGSSDLREEIAKLYGPNIGAENIVVFPGGQVALQIAAFALLDDSSHAIAFSPGYQSVQAAPRHAGARVTTIPLRPETGWRINPAEVEAAIQPNTKYLALNEPYNPTGTLMSAETQIQLRDIARKHGLYILSDEVYRLLEHDAKDRLPAMADLYEKGLSVVTMSKPWGACGLTIGWLAFQDTQLRQTFIDAQYFGTACIGRASELQAIMVLRASNDILEKNMTIIRRNMALLDDFMGKYSDLFDWVRPRAGAVAFVNFKGPLSSEQLGNELAKAGISIKPAYVFGEDTSWYRDYFRIGYGEEIMPKALEALIDFVETHKDEWRANL